MRAFMNHASQKAIKTFNKYLFVIKIWAWVLTLRISWNWLSISSLSFFTVAPQNNRHNIRREISLGWFLCRYQDVCFFHYQLTDFFTYAFVKCHLINPHLTFPPEARRLRGNIQPCIHPSVSQKHLSQSLDWGDYWNGCFCSPEQVWPNGTRSAQSQVDRRFRDRK